MLKKQLSRYSKKLSILLIILALVLPSSFLNILGKNSNNNYSGSINNMGAPSFHYMEMEVKDDLVILSTFGDYWEIWNTSDPKKPFLVKTIHFVSDGLEFISDMELINNYLFIKFLNQITIYDLADPTNPNNITTFSSPFSNIVEIHIDNDFLYLLQYVEHLDYVTSTLAILNISELNSIQLLGVYNSSIHHTSPNWHRNYDRLLIKDNFVYLVCPGNYYPVEVDPVLEIIDISNKSNPQKMGEFVLPSRPYSIRLRDDFVFIPTRYDNLQIVDCSNPSSPINVSKFDNYELISDIEIYDNVGYLVTSNKLIILDITDVENILTLGEYTIRNQGNTYFSYLKVQDDIVYTIGPSEHDDRYFFIFDCTDLTNPIKFYPRGIRISSETLFTVTIISTYAGIILGPILIIVGLFFLVRKLKQRKIKAYQNEEKS